MCQWPPPFVPADHSFLFLFTLYFRDDRHTPTFIFVFLLGFGVWSIIEEESVTIFNFLPVLSVVSSTAQRRLPK
jgi:hypothetical protein